MNDDLFLTYAKETLEIEINEAKRMLKRLDKNIAVACRILLDCQGKVVVLGVGKSGHIGKKIAASLASTGTPAFFIHPTEALHGDLGMIDVQDVVIFISYSGYVYEMNMLIPILKEDNIPIIALTGNIKSFLAKNSLCILNIEIQREACPMKLVPTSSAVNTLMMGDALTMALMRYRGFSSEQFARFHPGGSLGIQLLSRVCHVMRTGERISKVFLKEVTVMDAMFELSRTGLGLTAVCDDDTRRVIGVFTDGDLRRWLVQGKSLHDQIKMAMTYPGFFLLDTWNAHQALEMLYQRKITAAPVINSKEKLVGSINLHDFHQMGIK